MADSSIPAATVTPVEQRDIANLLDAKLQHLNSMLMIWSLRIRDSSLWSCQSMVEECIDLAGALELAGDHTPHKSEGQS